jgi:cold shock CspA family protein
MRTGKVRLYIPPKRYGVITADDDKLDVYFHMNDVKPRRCWMGAGMNVEFEDEASEGSRRAGYPRESY